MILHDQSVVLSNHFQILDQHLKHLGYEPHALHTGPLIRKESFYKNELMQIRKSLFNSLFHFTRKLNIHYLCPMINKYEMRNQSELDIISRLSKNISDALKKNLNYFSQFDSIIIYYDNGQIELTKILTSVFNSIFTNVEFRRVRPVDYKLFQVADLICTIELLNHKAQNSAFTHSELEFFGSPGIFKKNIYRQLCKKKL